MITTIKVINPTVVLPGGKILPVGQTATGEFGDLLSVWTKFGQVEILPAPQSPAQVSDNSVTPTPAPAADVTLDASKAPQPTDNIGSGGGGKKGK